VAWSTSSDAPFTIAGKTLASDGSVVGDLQIDAARNEAYPAVAVGRDGEAVATWSVFSRNGGTLFLQRFHP
jgi:hypothetical protein